MRDFLGMFMELYLILTLFILVIALFFRMELIHKSTIYALQESVATLNSNEIEVPIDIIQDLKTELGNTVEDLIGSMRVPTAIDHLAGVAANIFQMREQWKIQKEASQMDGLITMPTVGDEHGSP
jgi:hypothetical protein